MTEATGRSKVFISYSRLDLAFTNELAAALELSGNFDILIDHVGIAHGEAWPERLGKLIGECDTMVFVLSPDSVASEICAWEIKEARRLSKRIIPILWRAVDFAKIPDELSTINAVPFDGEHAVSGLPKLVNALKSDLGWLREHTRLGERAVEWEQFGHATEYLLRGAALVAARGWLDTKPANAPSPTELQRAFLQASEEEESRLLSDERKRLEELEKTKAIAEAERDAAEHARASEALSARRVVRATTAGLIVAVVLLLAASGAGWFAKQENERAERERDEARLIQSRFLARAARGLLAQGDTANAVALARAALPSDLSDPDRPFAIEAAQFLFDAYGQLREQATLRGHTGDLKGALALPGERIVTWGRDGTIRWWAWEGTPLKTVFAHKHPDEPGGSSDTGVHGVLHLDDGRLLSWGVDKKAKLWNDEGDFISTFLVEESWIRIERLQDGRIGAVIGNEYRVWDAALEPLFTLQGPLDWIRGATQLSDGRLLTWQSEARGSAHNAMLWQPDGTPGAVLRGHERQLRGGFDLADGRVVTFENGPSLRIWSSDGELEKVIDEAHRHVPWDPFAFPLRDGRFFTWGQEAYHDNVWWARLWNAQGDSAALIEASDSPLQGIELDDGRLLLGVNSQTPTIWRTDGQRGPALRGHEQAAYGAVQWADGRIATHAADGTARIWSRDGAPLLTLRGHEAGVSGIEPLSAGHYLTWSRSDRTARVWIEPPQPRSVLRFEGGDAKQVQQLSNGSLAVRTNTGSIVLFGTDLSTGPVLSHAAREITQLVELANGHLITRGEHYSNREPGPALRLWNSDGELIADLAEPDAEFLHVAQSTQGRIIAFEPSGQVWIWQADGQAERRHDAPGDMQVYRVTPLPDGRFLVRSHDGEHRLQLWSAEGEPGRVIRFDKSGDPPRQLLAHEDGRFSLIQRGGLIQTWDAADQQWSVLDLGDDAATDEAVALSGGNMLFNHFGGNLTVVKADRSVRRYPYPLGPDGRYQRHKIIQLADGRLLVSTLELGTRLWSADGEPGEQILDWAIEGAVLLADQSIVVWPAAGDGDALQLVGPDGKLGPLLRGHEAEIKQVIQLADGRILSRAEDATLRIWPGSIAQAVAWADNVIAKLQPLTLAERCNHYLEVPESCAEWAGP